MECGEVHTGCYCVSKRLQKHPEHNSRKSHSGRRSAKHTAIAPPLQVPPPLGPITAPPPEKRQGTWASSALISQPTAARPPQSGQASRALSPPLGISGPRPSVSNPGGTCYSDQHGGWEQRPALGQLGCADATLHNVGIKGPRRI